MERRLPMSSAVRRRRWTRVEYDRMVDSGGFGPEDRAELLDGEIWEMTPQGSQHATAFELVAKALQSGFPNDYVRHQLPFALDVVSEPEPDIAVVPGSIRDYADRHPDQALLIVEISESSLSHDRGRKMTAYARNGVPEYWLLDLKAARLEVCRDPAGDSYTSRTFLAPGDKISPLRAPESVIDVADLLP